MSTSAPTAEVDVEKHFTASIRQIHLAESNPGLWPTTPSMETNIPAARKIDGVGFGDSRV
jgi:hypothetical protein